MLPIPSSKSCSNEARRPPLKKQNEKQNQPLPALVWVKDRYVDEAELNWATSRIIKESQSARKISTTFSTATPADKRAQLFAYARQNIFNIGQLAHLLSNEALASLLEQVPPNSGLQQLQSLWPRRKSNETNVPPAKSKSRKSGKKRLFSSPMDGIPEGDFEDSASTVHNMPAYVSLPKNQDRTPPSVSTSGRELPEKIVLQTRKSKEQDLPIFVYGVNMFPDLLAHTSRIPLTAEELYKQRMCPAKLPNFLCTQVRQADWPAIISVGDAKSRLKTGLTFKTNDIFSGFRYSDYVTQEPVQLNNWTQAREIEPRGRIYEAFKKTVVSSDTGSYIEIDDIPRGSHFEFKEVLEVDVPYVPPVVDGMLVFGLTQSQRAKLDHFCGVNHANGISRKKPLFRKQRVKVEFSVRFDPRESVLSSEARPSLSRSGSEMSTLQTCRLSETETQASSGATENAPDTDYSPFSIYPRTNSMISGSDTTDSDHSLDSPAPTTHTTSFEPITSMTEEEVEGIEALERRLRADSLLQKLRPMVAAIKQEDHQLDKLKKMDYIMGIMDAYQREVEVITSDFASAHSSFGSTNTESSTSSGCPTGNPSVNKNAGKERQKSHNYVPVSMDAYAYVWAGPWCALENPKKCAWSERIYTTDWQDDETGSESDLTSTSASAFSPEAEF